MILQPPPINEPWKLDSYGKIQSPIWVLWLQDVVKSMTSKDYIQFNLDPPFVPPAIGTLSWNSTDDCLDIQGTNQTTQVGQELSPLYRNATGSTINSFRPVMYAGTVGNSGIIKIQKAIANGTIPNFYTLGITTEDILNGDDGHVTWYGKVRNVNTTGSIFDETWADGDILYISPTTAGYLTKTAPDAPNLRIPVAEVIHAHSNGTVFVRPSWGIKFTESDDVDGAATATGQFYYWDNSATVFKPTANLTIDDTNRTLATNTGDLTINCGTEKTVRLEEPVWQDIDFPIIIRTTGPNIPTLATVLGNLTKPQWAVNDFNVCESQEIIHLWEEGSAIRWHIHMLTSVQDASDRYVNWSIEFNYANVFGPGDTYNSTMTWQGSNIVQTSGDFLIPANTPARTMFVIPIYTWTYTGGKIAAHVTARLQRIASTGTAPSANPFCGMLQMHVQCDTIGSRLVGTK